MMSREAKRGLAFFGVFSVAAAVYVLSDGVLVDARLEWISHKDFNADRIINEPVRVCRYLHLTGVAERRANGDEAAQTTCGRVGSN